jgi:hypothetical protein
MRRINSSTDKYYTFILAAIIVFAFFIRLYNITFPAIGYHNVKEHEMISVAKNMLKRGDFFSRYADFHYGLEVNPKKIDLFPGGHITMWQTALCLKLFGENNFLAAARTINVLFFLVGIVLAFKITVLLTQSKPLGLLTAFVLSIFPLSIFFARNLQPECPAFTGMLACVYFYLRFATVLEFRYLFFSILCAVFVFVCKLSFLICFIPLLFIIPYRRLWDKYHLLGLARNIFLTLTPLIAVAAIFWFGKELSFRISEGRINLLEIFSASYWHNYGVKIFLYTVKESYTVFFTMAGLLGYYMAVRNRQNVLLRRFLFGWLAALVVYCMGLSDYINQHSYYQMPFMFIPAFSSAYALYYLGRGVNRLISHLGTALVILFFVSAIPAIYISLWEHYCTIFSGMDAAGSFIRNHTRPEERFFLNTWCQHVGISTYADRKCGWVKTLEEFKEKEKLFNIRFAVFYPKAYYNENTPQDIKKYINDHYHVVYVGFIILYRDSRSKYYNLQDEPIVLILQKGGAYDYQAFIKDRSPVLEKEYRAFDLRVLYQAFRDD